MNNSEFQHLKGQDEVKRGILWKSTQTPANVSRDEDSVLPQDNDGKPLANSREASMDLVTEGCLIRMSDAIELPSEVAITLADEDRTGPEVAVMHAEGNDMQLITAPIDLINISDEIWDQWVQDFLNEPIVEEPTSNVQCLTSNGLMDK